MKNIAVDVRQTKNNNNQARKKNNQRDLCVRLHSLSLNCESNACVKYFKFS